MISKQALAGFGLVPVYCSRLSITIAALDILESNFVFRSRFWSMRLFQVRIFGRMGAC